jgi:4-hydroxy-2-oxoheptanedioate aldolase
MPRVINQVKEKLQSGDTVLGVVCRTLSPVVVELIGLSGFDFVWIDMEHTGADFGTVEDLCRAADAAAVEPLVRVPSHDATYIVRALEVGASIVNVPQVNSAEDAEAIVRAARYFPNGERGCCPSSRGMLYGVAGNRHDPYAAANDRVMTMAQIESIQAVARADQICAVSGLDIIFVGTADLAQSMGRLGEPGHPEVKRAVREVLRAARNLHKPAAMLFSSVEAAREWQQEGVQMICCGVDVSMIGATLQRTAAEFGALVQGAKIRF